MSGCRMLSVIACVVIAPCQFASADKLLAQLSGPPAQFVAVADEAAAEEAATGQDACTPRCGVSAGCNGGCREWAGCNGDGSGAGLLGSVFDTVASALAPLGTDLKSDRAFDRFIEPVTNPVFFEDPRSRTRLRFIFINQLIPEGSLLQGGDLQVYGLEATFAINERLAIIAQKDGYIELQSDLLPNTEGTAELPTGLK